MPVERWTLANGRTAIGGTPVAGVPTRGHWVVLCACGEARTFDACGGADAFAELHVDIGCEGADHVISIEYRDARCGDPR